MALQDSCEDPRRELSLCQPAFPTRCRKKLNRRATNYSLRWGFDSLRPCRAFPTTPFIQQIIGLFGIIKVKANPTEIKCVAYW